DIGNAAHVANTAQRQLKLVALARQLKNFLLGQASGITRQLLFKRLETLDRTRNRLPVGEHPAQPAMVDEVLARTTCGIRNRFLRLALGANEQNLAAM